MKISPPFAAAASLAILLHFPGAAPASGSGDPYAAESELRIANFTLPEEFTATLFADRTQVVNPSAICFDDDGRLYVGEIHRWRAGVDDIRNEQHMLFDDLAIRTSEDRLRMFEKHAAHRPLDYYSQFADRVVRIEDTDGDGRADSSAEFAGGFNNPLDGPGIGLIHRDGKIYYTNIPHLWLLEDGDGDGKAEVKKSLQDGFGVRMSLSGHDMHGLAWGPDGRLYWSIGDRGYNITTVEGKTFADPMRGAVFRCNPDGSNVEEFYRGLRNPQELAFDKFGNLFTCDNNADHGDSGRLVYIFEGGDSGWSSGHQALLNFRDALGVRTQLHHFAEADKSLSLEPWMTERLWEPRHEGQPAWILPCAGPVSWGPSGLVYNYGATAFPERYANHFFVCNFGGSSGSLEAFTVKPAGAGFTAGDVHEFMLGAGNTDVEFGPDGRMYLSCFNNNGWVKQDIGNIYAIYDASKLDDPAVTGTHKLLLQDFGTMAPEQLDILLGHRDLRVRQKAQFALAARGGNARVIFTVAARDAGNRLKRLHAVWGLWQLGLADPSACKPLAALLADAETAPEVRAQCARVLADLGNETYGDALVDALRNDPSPRVKAFAAIGAGKSAAENGFDALIETLEKNDDSDAFLRHACVMGLYYKKCGDLLLPVADHPSPAVRRGAALAFRRWEDPRIAAFLDDPDESIYHEAVRAINDLDIAAALPELAACLDRYTPGTQNRYRVPETPRDFIIHSRIVNANFRLGKKENAARLLAYAANSGLPDFVRIDAALALEEWEDPNVIDSTVGYHRPLDPSVRDAIRDTVHDGMLPILKTAHESLLASAIRLAAKHDYEIPAGALLAPLKNTAAGIEVRIEALRFLGQREHPALDNLIPTLLKDESPDLRAHSCRLLVQRDPDAGVRAAVAMLETGPRIDRQNAYAILSNIEHPAATQALIDGLDRLLSRTEPQSTRLDLIEACEKVAPREAAIAARLKNYNESINPIDMLDAYRLTLEGGNAENGKTIFNTHAAGQCLKCHKVDGDGGVAGPDLTGLALRAKPDYILESLINPTAKIVPGYGLTLVTLKDGSNLGGNLIEETGTEIVVNIPDPSNPEGHVARTIARDDIDDYTPPISAMPPMGAVLRKREMRDLIAFLRSLDKAAPEDAAAHGKQEKSRE